MITIDLSRRIPDNGELNRLKKLIEPYATFHWERSPLGRRIIAAREERTRSTDCRSRPHLRQPLTQRSAFASYGSRQRACIRPGDSFLGRVRSRSSDSQLPSLCGGLGTSCPFMVATQRLHRKSLW